MTQTPAPEHLARLQRALAGRYVVEREIGRGGMACVYLAWDLRHQRHIAVKVLLPEISSVVGSQRFLREIRLTAGLQHPHILPLHDSGEMDGVPYYMTPYVAGESLRQRLEREGPLAVGEALALIRALAGALEYAHQHGVIHRDIKPENILLQNGEPLLADFGIALPAVERDRLTETGLAVGTPQYMSPEQALGERIIGPQSDIYSLAAVAYETLVGEPPVTGPSTKAIVARLLTESPRPIRTVRETVPVSAEAAILKALAKLPTDRFQNASQFSQALVSAPDTSAQIAKAPRAGRRGLVVSLTALVIVLILSTVWWGGSRSRSESVTQAGLALLPCEDASPAASGISVADRWSEELIQKLVRVGGLGPRSWLSVARYKGTRMHPREVAAELNVGTLVRCVVAEQPARVRLTVELIRDEEIIWANDYEQPAGVEGINTAQASAARDIAERFGVGIAPRALAAVVRPPTTDSGAWRLYRLGRHLLGLRGPQTAERSVPYFEGAIARDSSFALAYVGLVEATLFVGDRQNLASRDYYPRVGQLLRTAVRLDPTIAEAHTMLGLYLLEYTHDWNGAKQEHRRAITLNPSSSDVHLWYGWHLRLEGRLEEAIAESERALERDPTSRLARVQLVQALAFAGNEERVRREIRAAIEIDPDRHPIYYHYLAMILLRQGQRDSALAVLDRHPMSEPVWPDAWIHAAAGRPDKAKRLLDSLLVLNRSRPVDPSPIAALHAALGDSEEALEWLERAYEDRSAFVIFYLGPHPAFDALRGHPRFRELRKKVGLKS